MLFASLGGMLIFIGAVWLIVIAVQTGKDTTDKIIWALVNLICQPLGGIVFYIMKKQGLVPLLLILVGCVIGGFGYYSLIGDVLKLPAH